LGAGAAFHHEGGSTYLRWRDCQCWTRLLHVLSAAEVLEAIHFDRAFQGYAFQVR